MFFFPPAVLVVTLTTREQVQQTVNYIISRVKQIGVSINFQHSDGPTYLECKNTKEGVLERVDVYLAAGDYANVLPTREEIREGYIERVGYVHLIQGVAVLFRYRVGQEVRLESVAVYTVGSVYKDFKLNL
ncbi:MAG: hypothetical protein ACK4SY_02370 [Pyrobaculum sp.]